MKNTFINKLLQAMIHSMDNEQIRYLKQVLEYNLFEYEQLQTGNDHKTVNTTHDTPELLDLFLSAKRIEGGSAKSLKYYKSTINSMLSYTAKENNLQLIRTLAYGWKYKQLYERGMTASAIVKTEHRAERTIYKYLWLGYLSPKIISAIMDGNAPTSVDLQKLFSIAAKHLNFKDQEREFYSKI